MFYARSFHNLNGTVCIRDITKIECSGITELTHPVTLAEFTIRSGTDQDFYYVSLVDGFNLAILVVDTSGTGSCNSTWCITDINQQCPVELRVPSGEACMSACEAFHASEYCCSGDNGSPSTCKLSQDSAMFKSACPESYSYAYDDGTSTFTCTGADYTITFCPSSSTPNTPRSPNIVTNPNSSKAFTVSAWHYMLPIVSILFFSSLMYCRYK